MTSILDVTPDKRSWGDRTLNRIEWLGNKLPEPFALFVILFLLTGAVSTVLALAGTVVNVPGVEEPLAVKGLFTAEGLTWITTTVGDNYLGFPPLANVLPILLAVGIAERSGFLSSAIRVTIGSAPRWLLPYMVGFGGVVGSIMSDPAFLVVPPLAAMAFKAAGRHPMAGLLGGFAAVGAGWSTNIVPNVTDALFAGITTSVMDAVPLVAEHAAPVNAISNWYFNVISAIVLSLIAGFIIDRVLEPRMVRQGITRSMVDEEKNSTNGNPGVNSDDPVLKTSGTLTDAEKKGLIAACIALAVTSLVILAVCLLPASPWRNEAGGFLPKSPLLDSIVFLVMGFFAVGGLVYGRAAGTIRDGRTAIGFMGGALKEMTGFLVLAFILGQFIALFNWSGLGSWIAVTGAGLLTQSGVTGLGVIIAFIILCSLVNLFIISGSGMWTIMAAIFVPMLGLIGFEPSFVQAAFRIGDSATQVITPMNPYMILLLGLVRKYEPSAGIGTLIARMVPFVVPFWIAWVALLVIFFQFDLPLGPGNDIFIQEIRP